jgi:hypothetical protein
MKKIAIFLTMFSVSIIFSADDYKPLDFSCELLSKQLTAEQRRLKDENDKKLIKLFKKYKHIEKAQFPFYASELNN